MSCKTVFAMPMPHFEAIRHFLVTKLLRKPQILCTQKFLLQFLEALDNLQQLE